MQFNRFRALAGAAVVTSAMTAAEAQPVFDQDGPFGLGEDTGPPATCETIGTWIDRVPDYDGRISMAMKGQLVESHWDGTLAYLIMCPAEGVQVMCVTYHPEEVNGETILLAGGYNRYGETQVVLDPCLVFPAE